MKRLIGSNERGIALLLALLIVLVLLGLGGLYLLISQTSMQRTALDESYVSALSIAEAGAERAIWKIKDKWINKGEVWIEGFGCKETPEKIKDGNIEVGSYYVKVENLGQSMNSVLGTLTRKLKITSIGRKGKAQQLMIGSAVRGVEVIAELIGSGATPKKSDVFDYAYFLNNWGWWWWGGGDLEGVPVEWVRGDMRSNGRFDFGPASSWWSDPLAPRVDGHVWANLEINEHFELWPRHSHLRGAAGTCDHHPEGKIVYPGDIHSGLSFQHFNAGKGDMPNLQQPEYYITLCNGTIEAFLPEHIIINGLGTGTTANVVLEGSKDQPIILKGPVYIKRDVIIKGYVSGQGTIYSGRNVYIAGNIIYADPPLNAQNQPCYYPETTNPNGIPSDHEIQAWYDRNKNKDALAIAARESIIVGDYPDNTWSDGDQWWWPSVYGLFNMGSEDVGKDGIPDTKDQGENDGYFDGVTRYGWDKNYEDLDGDTIFDQKHGENQYGENYNWRDVTTTGLPSQQSNWIDGTEQSQNYANRGSTRNYHNLCDFGGISQLDGIFYTQHFLAGTFIEMTGPWQWTNTGFTCNGTLISKDECMVYYPKFNWNYDWRIHSRYRSDPNWPINLDLPPTEEGGTATASISIISWKEVNVK